MPTLRVLRGSKIPHGPSLTRRVVIDCFGRSLNLPFVINNYPCPSVKSVVQNPHGPSLTHRGCTHAHDAWAWHPEALATRQELVQTGADGVVLHSQIFQRFAGGVDGASGGLLFDVFGGLDGCDGIEKKHGAFQ